MFKTRIFAGIALAALVVLPASSQVNNPGVRQDGAVSANDCTKWTGTGKIGSTGAPCYAVTPQALTKTDDTNVTVTLGGTPASALLQPVSLTLGWTGTLAAGRLNSNVVQGVINDTNVTGSIAAQNLTLGWTGALAFSRFVRGTDGQIIVANTGADSAYVTMSGDATLNSSGVFTLNTVNANVGSFGSASNCASFTVNAKGLITAASQTACTGQVSSVFGRTGAVTAQTSDYPVYLAAFMGGL